MRRKRIQGKSGSPEHWLYMEKSVCKNGIVLELHIKVFLKFLYYFFMATLETFKCIEKEIINLMGSIPEKQTRINSEQYV